MKAFISVCVIGVFACDENGKLIDRELFDRNTEHIAGKLYAFNAGKIIPELSSIFHRLKNKYPEISLEAENNFGLQNIIIELPNPCGKVIRRKLQDLASEFGFFPIEHFIHNLCMETAGKKVKAALAEPDKKIIQAVSALDETDETLNLLSERLHEWKLLTLDEKDLFEVKKFDSSIANLNNSQKSLEAYMANLMAGNFPNLNAVAGFSIAAKLIAQAGGAERLAKLPSSTIQVLGAEKALFRHLKTGAKPPKYGIILKHKLLQSAHPKLRGKIARLLAAKISIAVKRDVYEGEFIGNELVKELEAKVQRIKKKDVR